VPSFSCAITRFIFVKNEDVLLDRKHQLCLSWSAIAQFIEWRAALIPHNILVVFNVAQVILLFAAKDILMAAYVQMVNVYVCIIATVLATGESAHSLISWQPSNP
jgi:hypothetical protein